MRIRGLSEAHIQCQITDFLALDGWRRLKTDPCSDRARGKGFGEKGMCDVLYIRYEERDGNGGLTPLANSHAQVLWIEHKKVGGKVSAHQEAWHRAERARGALVVVATKDFEPSLDGFLLWYRRSGLLRRDGL
jgi:hypothetical protein